MFFFLFAIPGTVLFVAVVIMCITYVSAGIYQINTGTVENNTQKRKGGVIALSISILTLALSGYLYWTLLGKQIWQLVSSWIFTQ